MWSKLLRQRGSLAFEGPLLALFVAFPHIMEHPPGLQVGPWVRAHPRLASQSRDAHKGDIGAAALGIRIVVRAIATKGEILLVRPHETNLLAEIPLGSL